MEDNREYFRAVSVFTNYEISSVGRVRNNKTGKVLKLIKETHGYWKANLYKNGKPKAHPVHTMVGNAFINNPSNKPTLDHIDRKNQ